MPYPSVAHARSADAVIDPAYRTDAPSPAAPAAPVPLYPRAVYESFLLVHMYEDMVRAGLVVGYDMSRIPGPCATVRYRRRCPAGPLSFTCTGFAAPDGVTLSGEPLSGWRLDGGAFFVELPREGVFEIALYSYNPKFRLSSLTSSLAGWEAARPRCAFAPAEPGGSPEGDVIPTVDVPMTEFAPGRFDAGREILATPLIRCAEKPVFGFGESLPELENSDPYNAEQLLELICEEPGVYRTPCPIAFRYLRAEASGPVSITCRAELTPEVYRGAFAADGELTRIWMNSAYTLRLCTRHFLIDGIKRDRLPWMGDHFASMLADAYAFADPEPCRRTLTVLGHPGIRRGHLNGIVDFTLWLPIASDNFQRYWGDRVFFERQYPELRDTLRTLLESSADSVFLPSAGSWLFIDWTPESKDSALQVLFFQSLHAGARLAARAADRELERACLDRAAQVKDKLLATSYDAARKLFFAVPGKPGAGVNRYANFLAVLAGLAPEDAVAPILDVLRGTELPQVGTPFMSGLEIFALIRGGAPADALARIRALWGGMLRLGATSFWEGFSAAHRGDEHFAFYDRPFGKSLCHAWASGPVFLLPLLFFGCEPLEDGWKKFKVSVPAGLPEADAASVAVCIPTPAGNIELELKQGQLQIKHPDALTCVRE